MCPVYPTRQKSPSLWGQHPACMPTSPWDGMKHLNMFYGEGLTGKTVRPKKGSQVPGCAGRAQGSLPPSGHTASEAHSCPGFGTKPNPISSTENVFLRQCLERQRVPAGLVKRWVAGLGQPDSTLWRADTGHIPVFLWIQPKQLLHDNLQTWAATGGRRGDNGGASYPKDFCDIPHLECTSWSREGGRSMWGSSPGGPSGISDSSSPQSSKQTPHETRQDKKKLKHKKMLTQNPSSTKRQKQKDPARPLQLPQSLQYFQTRPSSRDQRGKTRLWIKSPASHLLSGLWHQHSPLVK